MTGNHVRISFSMHPLWLTGADLTGFLSPLVNAGLGGLEFLLDRQQRNWEGFAPLMEACAGQGLALSYHAPYSSTYTLAGFSASRRAEVETLFTPLFQIAQRFPNPDTDQAVVVVHGAKSRSSNRQDLYADTLAFLNWSARLFPRLVFALENLGPAAEGEIKIGDTRAEVLDMVCNAASPRVGICWDLGHDALHKRRELPPAEWLEKVVHVHVHDLDEAGLDHYPLGFGRVSYQHWLPALADAGWSGTVCLEVKGDQLGGWGLDRINRSLIRSIEMILDAFK